MPSRLPDNYKSLVIQQWLNGEQRDKIAVDNGLGAGSVTNIVNEWRVAPGFSTADALRDLAVTLRRVGITASQCALGFRIATLMLRIGVKEESFESLRDKALQDEEMTSPRLKWYIDVRAELSKYGCAVDDISELAKLFKNLKQYEYNVENVINEFLNLESIRVRHKYLQEDIQSLENTEKDLKQRCSSLEQEELIHTHRISLYHELEKSGMDIKKLNLLRHTVVEIATANNVSQDKAVQKFFSDVEQQYDYLLGFESKVQNLKSEIEKNEHMRLQLANFTAMLNYLILWQLDQIQSVSGFVEFGPLGKAARGQKVPKNALKNAVIKAMDILISSDPTDRSVPTLNMTKSILQNDVRESDVISSPTK